MNSRGSRRVTNIGVLVHRVLLHSFLKLVIDSSFLLVTGMSCTVLVSFAVQQAVL
jgi:hypothetical protein